MQKINLPHDVSPAVVKRLPRYFRYLRELIRQGKLRISSSELSKLMQVTASQVRQDLNCFGGFGQQGYGYNVNHLYAKICEILGVGEGYSAIVIGAGNLGRALVRSPMFEKRGVNILAMFDVDAAVVSTSVGDIPVHHMDELESFCARFPVDIAVLTLPKSEVKAAAKRLLDAGVQAFWNFTGRATGISDEDAAVENVHIGDSLMTLCYDLRSRQQQSLQGEQKYENDVFLRQ
jgi:redox-sensing transcriptional repressor